MARKKSTARRSGATRKRAGTRSPKKAAGKAPRRPPGKAGPVDKVIGAGAAVGGAIAGTMKDVAQKILP